MDNKNLLVHLFHTSRLYDENWEMYQTITLILARLIEQGYEDVLHNLAWTFY